MSSGKQFSADISAWVAKAKGNVHAVVRAVILDIGTRMIMRSPVGNPSLWKSKPPLGYAGGRFRANWQYGEGKAVLTTTEQRDPSGAVSLERLYAMDAEPAGKVHYITNNLPYALKLERGHSRQQAPAGMVAVTLVEFAGIVEVNARRVAST